MVFKNIKKSEKLYVRIAEEINNLIVTGVLKSGDKLPPEREIAEQLGVSRPSVREALAVLDILGVIDIKIGDGSYVKEKVNYFNLEMRHLKHSGAFELVEARFMIESLVVEIAVERATDAQIAILQETIDSMKKWMDEDLEEFFAQGVRFHEELAAATGNDILGKIVKNLVEPDIHPLWRILNKKAIISKESKEHQILEHQEIVESIKSRDKERARKAMSHHLKHVEELMLS